MLLKLFYKPHRWLYISISGCALDSCYLIYFKIDVPALESMSTESVKRSKCPCTLLDQKNRIFKLRMICPLPVAGSPRILVQKEEVLPIPGIHLSCIYVAEPSWKIEISD